MKAAGGRTVLLLLAVGAAALAVGLPLLTRPFWYDEAWRAWFVARGPDQWSVLPQTSAPVAAGWLLIEQAFGAVFGLHEWALRLPSVLALLGVGPSTYLLGRWWLSRPAACVAAVLVTFNGELFVYGLQLKSYLVEAALTPLIVHSWLCARRARERGQRTWPAYAGIGGLALISLPAVFVIAPLLLWDLRDGWRTPRRLAAPALAGAITLVHFAVVVRRQSFLVHDTGWYSEWIHGPGQALGQLVSYLGRFPLNGMTENDDNPTSPFTGSPLIAHAPVALMAVTAVVVGGFLLRALVAARAEPALKATAVAFLGSIALITAAALADKWPAGPVRVNVFLIPMLALLAVTGASLLPLKWLSLVLAAAVLAGGVRWTYVAGRSTVHDDILLGGVKQEQQLQRAAAQPGDLAVILTGRVDYGHFTHGALFYAQDYPWGTPGVAVPTADTLQGNGWVAGQVTRWIGDRKPHAVFVTTYNRVTDTDAASLVAELRADGWCVSRSVTERLTGTWSELTPCG